MSASVSKPRRALVLFFEEGEDITAIGISERLAERQYAILPRPAVMRAPEPRHLQGIIAMPDDALEDDKRKRRAVEVAASGLAVSSPSGKERP